MADSTALVTKKRRSTLAIMRREFALYTLIAPAIVFTIVFSYLPMFINVIAFMDYDMFAGWLGLGSRIVGFKWFQRFLSDPFFWQVAWRTIYYSLVKLAFTFPMPIVLALLLNEVRSSTYKRVSQTLSYLPHFVSWVTVSSLVYTFLSTSSYGLINNFFRQTGVIPNVAMELDSLEATKRMVEEGLGIALLPLVTIERELAAGTLVKVDLIDAEPIKRPISLIYRRHRKRPRTVQAFIDMLTNIYSPAAPTAAG